MVSSQEENYFRPVPGALWEFRAAAPWEWSLARAWKHDAVASASCTQSVSDGVILLIPKAREHSDGRVLPGSVQNRVPSGRGSLCPPPSSRQSRGSSSPAATFTSPVQQGSNRQNNSLYFFLSLIPFPQQCLGASCSRSSGPAPVHRGCALGVVTTRYTPSPLSVAFPHLQP